MAAVDCLDKFIYILSGSNVHFRTDTPVNSMADTDIFYTASAVYDQIQFLRCLFLSMTDLKFSGTCAVFILLQYIPFCSRQNPWCRGPDYSHILHDYLSAHAKLCCQRSGRHRFLCLMKEF